MSSASAILQILGAVCAVIPFVLNKPRTAHQKNVDFLNSLHVRNLTPLPITPVQHRGVGATSSSCELVSSIEAVQKLFDDPEAFLRNTLVSTSEFRLLHSHVKEEIASSRSHRHSASPHKHPMPTRLTTVEQLFYGLCILQTRG